MQNEELLHYLNLVDRPYLYLSYVFVNDKKMDLAWETIEKYLKEHPDEPEGLLLKGSLLFFDEKYDAASMIYNQVIQTDKNNFEAIYYLAKIAFIHNDPDSFAKIQNDYSRVLDSNQELSQMVIEFFISKELFDEAIQKIDTYLENYPEYYYGYFIMGNLYQEMNDNGNALKFYHLAMEKYPDDQEVINYIQNYVESVENQV